MIIPKEERLYSVQEVLAKNGGPIPMSMSGIYQAIKKGAIPIVSIGKRKFIRGSFLRKLLRTE